MVDPITSAIFREGLAHFASGVTIVTARKNGSVAGFTATAFSSVSLEPPLVLICIAKCASAYEAVMSADHLGVNILREDQQHLGEQFAKSNVDRFAGVAVDDDGTTAPLIKDAIVQLACKPHTKVDAGDHIVLILAVDAAQVQPGRPLLHFARRFERLG